MNKRIFEGVVTALIIGVTSGFIGLFIHVQRLEAAISKETTKYDYIRKELEYIRHRVDHLYELSK